MNFVIEGKMFDLSHVHFQFLIESKLWLKLTETVSIENENKNILQKPIHLNQQKNSIAWNRQNDFCSNFYGKMNKTRKKNVVQHFH